MITKKQMQLLLAVLGKGLHHPNPAMDCINFTGTKAIATDANGVIEMDCEMTNKMLLPKNIAEMAIKLKGMEYLSTNNGVVDVLDSGQELIVSLKYEATKVKYPNTEDIFENAVVNGKFHTKEQAIAIAVTAGYSPVHKAFPSSNSGSIGFHKDIIYISDTESGLRSAWMRDVSLIDN